MASQYTTYASWVHLNESMRVNCLPGVGAGVAAPAGGTTAGAAPATAGTAGVAALEGLHCISK